MNDTVKMTRHTVATRTVRNVHRIAKMRNEETGAIETGFVTDRERVSVCDLYTTPEGAVFWRGARVA